MTQDEIIELAIGMGLEYRKNNNEINTPYCDGIHIDELRIFAKLVAEREREACAKICDEFFKGNKNINYSDTIAICIRAREQA